jgi:archaemetzincin
MQFSPPGKQAQSEAIGTAGHFPEVVRRLLDPSGFSPMDVPGPADWLSFHPEAGQTAREFIRSHPDFPDEVRRTIYLQPLEEFPPDWPALSQLKTFTEAFFAMPVRILPAAHRLGKITKRVNFATGKQQLLTPDIRKQLKPRLPRDGYCLLGITLSDLYPDPAWNYVFGEASIKDRVGIYSFARYDPRFFGIDSPDRTQLILRRSCKVLAHEAGHMFGIAHCIYFR